MLSSEQGDVTVVGRLHTVAGTGSMALLACMLLASPRPAAAQEHPADGLVHATDTFELVKRVSGSQRSAMRPKATESRERVRQRKAEARLGLEQLGGQLQPFLESLRSTRTPYPLLREVILDYAHLRPVDQSDESGRMYIMYIGELYWPFPAPLLADLLRIRVRSPISQGTRDLLTVALRRWGRDTVEPARQDETQRRQKILGWLDDLESPGLLGMRWRRDQVINDLLRARLGASDVERLRKAARSEDVTVQLGALRVLGVGGWVEEASFYVPLLASPSVEVQRAAFWALVYMRGSAALVHLRSFAGRDEAVAQRLRDVRPVASAMTVYEDVAAFNRLIGAPVPPRPQEIGEPEATTASAEPLPAEAPEAEEADEPTPLPEPDFPD